MFGEAARLRGNRQPGGMTTPLPMGGTGLQERMRIQ